MIIFDLDGTITNDQHRRHILGLLDGLDAEQHNQDIYARFNAACIYDKPNPGVIKVLVACVTQGMHTEIWTGRPEYLRGETHEWFNRYCPLVNVRRVPILMRPTGDVRPSAEIKSQWLDMELNEGQVVDIVFDDLPHVIAMWRRRGIEVARIGDNNGRA